MTPETLRRANHLQEKRDKAERELRSWEYGLRNLEDSGSMFVELEGQAGKAQSAVSPALLQGFHQSAIGFLKQLMAELELEIRKL